MSESDTGARAVSTGEAAPRVARGRNIVLLSDGTGNSAAKLNRTNVWRLYEALDLSDGSQIALYDDGVGTSGFKPLRILGGALGVGLARNVCDLYEFLCRHYRAPSADYEGDHIYVFGFSRGGFTARTVADLITTCGIIDRRKTLRIAGATSGEDHSLETDDALRRVAKLAYRTYRRDYAQPLLAKAYRPLEDAFLGAVPSIAEFRARYAHEGKEPVKAVGVWDTVSAYGLPIEELSIIFDTLFFKHRYSDRTLNKKVEKAYHALAIDDERQTFHPVLWNETEEESAKRITQVWFPGMHSNVGGGYAKDELSFLSFDWMVKCLLRDAEGSGRGLAFSSRALADIGQRLSDTALMHNSRAGTGVYYRYKPRIIEELLTQVAGEKAPAKAKIHKRVLDRVRANSDGYTPIGLPAEFDVVDEQGEVLEPAIETDAQRAHRVEHQQRASQHVFWRRVNYFVMVFATIGLLLMPLLRPPVPGLAELDGLQRSVAAALGLLQRMLPDFLAPWFDAFAQSPVWFLTLCAFIAALIMYSIRVQSTIQELTQSGLWHLRASSGDAPKIADAKFFERVAKTARDNTDLVRFYNAWTKQALPILVFLLSLYVVSGAAYRLAFHNRSIVDDICSLSETTTAAGGGFASDIEFDTRMPCLDTGVELVEGRTYELQIVDESPWRDGTIAADHAGYDSLVDRATFLVAVPARRHLTLPWFALTAQIGRHDEQIMPIAEKRTVFEARTDGNLYLYVNDALKSVAALPSAESQSSATPKLCVGERAWCAYYANNEGTAILRVSEK